MEITIQIQVKDGDVEEIEQVLSEIRKDILEGYEECRKYKINNFYKHPKPYLYQIKGIGEKGK